MAKSKFSRVNKRSTSRTRKQDNAVCPQCQTVYNNFCWLDETKAGEEYGPCYKCQGHTMETWLQRSRG